MALTIGLIGGLGLFLFGMIFMGDALQKAAGSKLKDLLAKLTQKKIYSILMGCIVTVIIQSSSATTVMTVGFVNAGLLNLTQAIGIIMGSNIGTTVTAQLVSFDIEVIAPLIIGIAVGVYLLAKNKSTKNISNIFIGFGILFLGMGLMKDAIKPLKDSQVFIEAIVNFNNPIIGLMTGLAITAVLQSSAATTGLLIAVAGSGLLTIEMAFPVILGSNIGTCVTALLSSLGTNKTAKRAAVIHIVIKILGALAFLIYLRFPVQTLVEYISPLKVERQIANAHTLFNIITVIAVYPFSSRIVELSHKIIKGEDEKQRGDLKFVDNRLLATPDIAIGQIKKEILRMFNIVNQQLINSKKIFLEFDRKLSNDVFETEEVVNKLETSLVEYTVALTSKTLNEDQIDKVALLARTITDVERIGDLAENLVEMSMINNRNRLDFSETAKEEIKELFDKVTKIYTLSRHVFESETMEFSVEIQALDKEIKKLGEVYLSNHIKRIKKPEYNTHTEIVFLDTLSNLERIGNHSKNITESVLRFTV
jgi:phosphate:Na+ symporter